MTVELLFLVTAVIGIASRLFSKCCSNLVPRNTVSGFSVILTVNSVVACIFFFITGGFSLSVNGITLLYSVAYALIAAVSIISTTVVYRYTSISNVTVISSSCGMIATALMGSLIFSEHIDLKTVLRLAVMLVAILLVFLDQRRLSPKVEKQKLKKRHWLPLVLCIAVITLTGCANTLLLKAFTTSEAVTDDTTFFFFTNVFLCAGAVVVLIACFFLKREDFRDSLRLLRPLKLVTVAGNTVCSNVSSIITVLLVAQMDVSLYSPIASAIGILAGVVGSLIFREKQSYFAYIAAGVACIAIFI